MKISERRKCRRLAWPQYGGEKCNEEGPKREEGEIEAEEAGYMEKSLKTEINPREAEETMAVKKSRNG